MGRYVKPEDVDLAQADAISRAEDAVRGDFDDEAAETRHALGIEQRRRTVPVGQSVTRTLTATGQAYEDLCLRAVGNGLYCGLPTGHDEACRWVG